MTEPEASYEDNDDISITQCKELPWPAFNTFLSIKKRTLKAYTSLVVFYVGSHKII